VDWSPSKWKLEGQKNIHRTSLGFATPLGNVLNFWGVLRSDDVHQQLACKTTINNGDLDNFSGLEMEIMGTPREFRFQLKPQTNNTMGIIHYEHTFSTTGKWNKIRLPFSTAKFAILDNYPDNAGALSIGDIKSIEFVISDKKYNEPFLLSVRHIHGYK